MACGTHHPTLTAQVPDSKGKFRCGPEFFKKKNFYTVSRHNIRYDLRKKTAVVPAVMRDGHADDTTGERLAQVVGITLGRHTHGVFVHSIRTHAHDAPQTTSAKFKVTVKGVIEFRAIGFLQGTDLLFGLFIIISFKPLFSSFEGLFHINRLIK